MVTLKLHNNVFTITTDFVSFSSNSIRECFAYLIGHDHYWSSFFCHKHIDFTQKKKHRISCMYQQHYWIAKVDGVAHAFEDYTSFTKYLKGVYYYD